MSFIDHLEELRWHIIRSVASIFIFAIAALYFHHFIFHEVLLGPSRTDFWTYRMLCKLSEVVNMADLCVNKLDFILQSRQVGGQFMTYITTAALAGLIGAFPYAFWEVWRFIKPGLRPEERRAARGAVFYVTLLFLSGVLFGYYIISPLTINFLANFKLDESISNEFDIGSYFSILATLTIACGAMFELPMVVFFLSKAGVVTPSLMREYRRHAYVVILVIAAIITPSPDMISQILVAMPLFFLYEISISVSARVEKQRQKAWDAGT
ncbi:twin-arginine translocase subunit TatC [Xanthocytophaga agilis]|uniref:Sec-independent protein translocase protein TatC n=1 Tax=Xanthocytophaga agilis TaxID=3048010 RepID=A0AAE3R6N9_9BACT|nr:twin-arginine translocase subunit TatC [Xanthocytophaga agilis]MDJ1502587.1 twin-arginine translocase subunit TatC [Xanthocytophaga agilis]